MGQIRSFLWSLDTQNRKGIQLQRALPQPLTREALPHGIQRTGGRQGRRLGTLTLPYHHHVTKILVSHCISYLRSALSVTSRLP